MNPTADQRAKGSLSSQACVDESMFTLTLNFSIITPFDIITLT